MSEIIEDLYKVILNRKGKNPEKSYTAKLFSKGKNKIAQKFGEEAVETVVAYLNQGKKEVVSESADMLFHLLVLWAEKGVEPSQVYAELESRLGKSGIDEKNSRK